MQIDSSEKQPENASRSIRPSLEFDSNVNVESEVHQEKQDSQRTVTEEGIQSNLSDEHP
jgi:hypothetical protein